MKTWRDGFAVIACALAATAMAQTPLPPLPTQPVADESLATELAQVDAVSRQIKDLSAKFEQKKFTALLKKPLISSGTTRAAGSAVRWDTVAPQACILYADQGELRLYYPEQKLEEIYSIDQRLADLLSSPLPRLATIERHFSIARAGADELTDDLAGLSHSPSVLALHLTPSDAELAKHVKQVIVLLNAKSGVTMAVQTTDADGDRTQIIFSDIRTDVGMDARQLELHVPADTTISHPLSSAPSSNNTSP